MSRRGLWLIPLLAATIALLAMLGLRPVSFAERLRRLAGELAGDVPNGRADAIARVDPRDAIGAVNAAYLEALLRGNAHAYAATYHDDGIAVPGTSAIVRGRSAIERAMTHTFSTIRFLEAEMSTVDRGNGALPLSRQRVFGRRPANDVRPVCDRLEADRQRLAHFARRRAAGHRRSLILQTGQ
jgi:ketosteroid isomerase-like protein